MQLEPFRFHCSNIRFDFIDTVIADLVGGNWINARVGSWKIESIIQVVYEVLLFD